MPSALTTSVFILPFHFYKVNTPTATVIDANPTATTLQLSCPKALSEKCKYEYNNTLVIGPWARTTVPKGAASTGTFHFSLAFSRGHPMSVECLMSSGTPQACTSMYIPTNSESAEAQTATGIEDIEASLDLSFSSLPIVITAGQELLESATHASTTKDSSTTETTGSEAGSTKSEATATATSTDAAASQESNAAGSSAARVLGAMAMAGLASLIVHC
ncbi:hypothetical protein F53441_826 [Fusarium austroafricanum]|uniref:Uncharacterized protein n=1 Tax=Fusarium austroafricanum TaxID=2364996 RepID=A0A8H4KVX3_9HYPO|nr:hypothetical protein F53441_826 [Fusarium austroafricanum]